MCQEKKEKDVNAAFMPGSRNSGGVALVVAMFMADGQIFQVAVAALAQRLDVLQGGGFVGHMLATHPARYHAVHLPCDGFINLFSGEG